MLGHPCFSFDARRALASLVLLGALVVARDTHAQSLPSVDDAHDASATEEQAPHETADDPAALSPSPRVAASDATPPTRLAAPTAPLQLALPPPTADAMAAMVSVQFLRDYRHAKRLAIAGWTIFGIGFAGLVVGMPVAHVQEQKSIAACRAHDPMDGWCDFLQGLPVMAVAIFGVPVMLVGMIVGGRGSALKNRLLRASSVSIAPTASRSTLGFTLRGSF